jgi:UDP:flavonoid glycosyltransferase YjiC (YdhE family)
MKLAAISPCVAVVLELLRRGHELRKAVPPNPVDFVESTGLAAVAYGPDSHERRSCGRENSLEACWLIS